MALLEGKGLAGQHGIADTAVHAGVYTVPELARSQQHCDNRSRGSICQPKRDDGFKQFLQFCFH